MCGHTCHIFSCPVTRYSSASLLFTYPHVVSNPYNLFCGTQKRDLLNYGLTAIFHAKTVNITFLNFRNNKKAS